MEPNHISPDENNIPQEQFGGLTVHQVYALVNEPLSQASPLKVNHRLPEYILDQLPFFRSCEDFLGLLDKPGGIKLTASGSLPKPILLELYKRSIAKNPSIGMESRSVSKIADWNFLDSACQVCLIAGLIKLGYDNIELTKKGKGLLKPVKRTKLFELLLVTFGQKFNWAYNDGYTEAGVGQVGWAYTLFMLMQFGEKGRPDSFYADRYYKAFPMMKEYFEDEYIPVDEEANDCYALRAIHRFAAWWGFVNASDTDFVVPQIKSARTVYDHLYDLFDLDELRVDIPGTGTYD